MNTMMKTKNVFAGLVLASSGLFASGASAAWIGAWDWQSDGGFVTSTATCQDGSVAPGTCNLNFDNVSGETSSTIAGTASIMTWGTGTGLDGGNGEQSGLQGIFGGSLPAANGPFDGQLLGSGSVPIPEFEQIVTNDGWTNTGAAVHYNNVITQAGGNMETSTLSTTFQLLTPAPGVPVPTTLDILFDETPNSGSCPAGNPLGTTCDDLFSLTGMLDPITFTVGTQIYKASFRLVGGANTFIDGNTIYTAETSPGTSVLFVQGRIDSIPLPGVLALMGMGLVMVGWQVRGRRKLV